MLCKKNYAEKCLLVVFEKVSMGVGKIQLRFVALPKPPPVLSEKAGRML